MAVGLAVAVWLALAGSFQWPPAGEPPELGVREPSAVRTRAVLELAAAADAVARTRLVPLLQDRDADVRIAAGRLLARRGAPEATEAATAWLSTTFPALRLVGLRVLREVAELTPAARRAVERATRDGDLVTRVQALDVLGGHEPAASFGAVLAALADEHRDVRARAARILGQARDARAALPLVARLEDGDRQVRIEALVALGALGAAGERRVVPALLRQLDEAPPEQRLATVDALAAAGDPAAVPALQALARRRPRDELARRALLALGRLATPAALETLRALVRDPEVLADARDALLLAGTRAAPLLERELVEGTPTSAVLAAELLGALRDRRATPALVAAVDARASVAPAALAALARLGDDAAVPALLRAATATSAGPDLRAAALTALAALRDDRAAEALPRVLADAKAPVDVRVAALEAAGACGGPSLAPVVAARLADAEPAVRRAAALAVARLAAPSAEVTRAILAALARGGARGATELDALGDALERSASPGDATALEEAYVTAPAAGRAPLARGLAAVHADAPLASRRVIEALIDDLGQLDADDARASAAADALSTARAGADQQEALTVAFARADDGVAARLAPALARFRTGARQLIATVRDPQAGPARRAAAAWALAGVSEAEGTLRAALADGEPAVAANARAALAAGRTRPEDGATPRWTAFRLVTADGAPWPRRWVTFARPGRTPLWTLTDLAGRARLADTGAPEGGPPTVSLPEPAREHE